MKTFINPQLNNSNRLVFDLAFDFVLKAEGHLSNDSNDNGGLTKYGISQAAYPELDIRSLSIDDVRGIYFNDYWLIAGCDELPPHVAIALFGGAVNHGVTGAIKLLQEAAKTKPDGIIGPVTRGKIYNQRLTILNRFLAKRARKYSGITTNDPSQQKYLFGWLLRLFKLHQYINDHSNKET